MNMPKKTLAPFLFGAVVLAAILCIYLPGLHNGLVFDDVRLTDGVIMEGYGNLLKLQQRMLSYGSFVWIQDLFGEGWWKQRIFNLVVHIGVVAALFALFRELLAQTHFPLEFTNQPHFGASRTAALCVGVAVYALNPMSVYAVAYLVQRSILMATLFTVLACLAFVRGLVTGRRLWFPLALVAYVLAVLSKEHALMAAALTVPLYVYIKRPSLKRVLGVGAAALVLLGLVVAALATIYGSILGVAFDTTSIIFQQQLELLRPGIGESIFPLSIVNQAWLFFKYGALWLLPNPFWMSIDLRPTFPLTLTAFPQVLGAIGYVALLVGCIWAVMRRRNVVGFAGLCLLMPLLLFWTEFSTVWVQDPFVLYRSYLWAIALPGLVAMVLTGFSPRLIYPLGIAVGVVFAGIAWERVSTLRDEETAWNDAVERVDLSAPANAVGRWRPYLNRGAYHLDRASPTVAFTDFAMADRLGELKGSARYNMGVALQQQKKHQEALAAFASAAKLGKDDFELHYQRGESYFALGQMPQAFADFSAALAKPTGLTLDLNKKLTDLVRLRRAETGIYLRRFDVATSDLAELAKNQPNVERIQVGLGMARIGLGDLKGALEVFDKMLLRRASPQAYYGRALVHFYQGNYDASERDLMTATLIDPGNPQLAALRSQLAEKKK